jgi:hypothetical protein
MPKTFRMRLGIRQRFISMDRGSSFWQCVRFPKGADKLTFIFIAPASILKADDDFHGNAVIAITTPQL